MEKVPQRPPVGDQPLPQPWLGIVQIVNVHTLTQKTSSKQDENRAWRSDLGTVRNNEGDRNGNTKKQGKGKERNVPAHPRGGSGGGAADTKVAKAGEEGSANTTGLGVIDNQPASGTRVATGRVGLGGDGTGGAAGRPGCGGPDPSPEAHEGSPMAPTACP